MVGSTWGTLIAYFGFLGPGQQLAASDASSIATALDLQISATASLAMATATSTQTTASAASPSSTACADIVTAANDNGTLVFRASTIYECLTSVPFNAAVASRFLQYWYDTLQFQSTLAYLRNPPASYQQPAVDLLVGLNYLQQAIDHGLFSNQYEFEAALQALLFAAHDGHLYLQAGILSPFMFASPYDIVSVSIDGIQAPKVYLAEDLVSSDYFRAYVPQAIITINGVDVTEYLDDFARLNSPGSVELHADWNKLMLSMAEDIQGYLNVFGGGSTFYPGDNITFGYENGSFISEHFYGIYSSPGPTGPLQTSGDFYNFFVLGQYPASYDPNDDSDDSDDSDGDDNNSSSSSAVSSYFASSSTIADVSSSILDASSTMASSTMASSTIASRTCASTSEPTGWDNAAYPDIADVAGPDLGSYDGGFVSGYFLNSSSLSVLSIPSFEEYGDNVDTFGCTISEFLSRSRAAGLEKIVVDLQQNAGGHAMLAFETFRHFFPGIQPFAGSRMRAHYAADVMGSNINGFFVSLNASREDYETLAADEWVVADRLNAATERNFTSWDEFFGPFEYNGDNCTATQRYNFSSDAFVEAAMGSDQDFDLFSTTANTAPPYAASDIILLTDGTCGSACSLFVEMMHHEAGVRVITAGGRPVAGPMQGASGSRGAAAYDTYTLDDNIDFTRTLLQAQSQAAADAWFPARDSDNSVDVLFAGVNLRDQVRRNNQATPLQFAYDAADCRIYYTPLTVFNYTALWLYAAEAAWKKPGLCVANSTGWATTPNSTASSDMATASSALPASSTPSAFQVQAHIPGAANYNFSEVSDAISVPEELGAGYLDDTRPASRTTLSLTECSGASDTSCGTDRVCKKVTPCKGQPAKFVCVSSCSRFINGHGTGAGGSCLVGKVRGTCVKNTGAQTSARSTVSGDIITTLQTKNLKKGYCDISQSTADPRTCTWKENKGKTAAVGLSIAASEADSQGDY